MHTKLIFSYDEKGQNMATGLGLQKISHKKQHI
jgi:hypothetical protein